MPGDEICQKSKCVAPAPKAASQSTPVATPSKPTVDPALWTLIYTSGDKLQKMVDYVGRTVRFYKSGQSYEEGVLAAHKEVCAAAEHRYGLIKHVRCDIRLRLHEGAARLQNLDCARKCRHRVVPLHPSLPRKKQALFQTKRVSRLQLVFMAPPKTRSIVVLHSWWIRLFCDPQYHGGGRAQLRYLWQGRHRIRDARGG